jgi:hypothetical protein
MICSLEDSFDILINQQFTRREWFRSLLGGFGLYLAVPLSIGQAASQAPRSSILEHFLGEELTYQIGFAFFPRCGEAKTRLSESEYPGLYQASLEWRTVGFIDWLFGGYQYSYTSNVKISSEGNRFQPVFFQLTGRHRGKEMGRSIAFDYSGKEIIFSRSTRNGKREQERVPMQEETVYEDYLTLFYNFRHGCYGPLKRGRTYRLPLHIHEGMNSVDLSIAPRKEEEKHRQREIKKAGKDFLLRFRVNREDVSSETGNIEAWLSRAGVPTKGCVKDVIFFGDLWGELIHHQVRGTPPT